MNEVYNADCIEWMSAYSGPAIDLIVTDPPYTLPSWSGGGFMDESKRDWIKEMDVDNLSRGYSIEAFADLAEKVQGGKINAYFFCNKLQIPDYFRVYVEQRKCKFDILMWHKTNAMPTFHGKYLTDTEYILYFRNGGGVIQRPTMTQRLSFLRTSTFRTKRNGSTLRLNHFQSSVH